MEMIVSILDFAAGSRSFEVGRADLDQMDHQVKMVAHVPLLAGFVHKVDLFVVPAVQHRFVLASHCFASPGWSSMAWLKFSSTTRPSINRM